MGAGERVSSKESFSSSSLIILLVVFTTAGTVITITAGPVTVTRISVADRVKGLERCIG